MTKPTQKLVWADAGTGMIDPAEDAVDTWASTNRPPYQYFNYIHRTISLWQDYIDDVVDCYDSSLNTSLGFTSGNSGGENTAVGYGALTAVTGDNNVAVGMSSLVACLAGNENTAVGCQSLASNTSGNYNTAIGEGASQSNITGNAITAIGHKALALNTVSGNTAVGYEAITSNTAGEFLTAMGNGALRANTTGNNNTAIGYDSLHDNDVGSLNCSVGYNNLYNNTSGDYNTSVGTGALHLNTTGDNNTAIGNDALASNTVSGELVAVGAGAMQNAVEGTGLQTNLYNTAVGYRSMQSGQGTPVDFSFSHNTAVGSWSLNLIASGSYNTAVGSKALYFNNTGEHQTAVGYNSLLSNMAGSRNTAVGCSSMEDNVTGVDNTAVGHCSLQKAIDSYNTSLGAYSMSNLVTGRRNVAVGYHCLSNIIPGDNDNTGVGSEAGRYCTSQSNTFVGKGSGKGSSGAGSYYNNVCIGEDSGTNLGAGAHDNTFVGYLAGSVVSTGDYNICVGYGSNPGDTDASNVIIIGNDCSHAVSDNNSCYIDNIYDQTAGTANVFISSAGKLSRISSSKVYKENIKTLSDTSWLYKLKPVEFNRKNDKSKSMGFIAEEVAEHNSEAVEWANEELRNLNFDRKNLKPAEYKEAKKKASENKNPKMVPDGVNYALLVAPIIAEMKKLKERLDFLESSKN